MATVGTLIVKLQADISDFARSMDTAMGKLQKSMNAALPASQAVLGGVTALAAAFGAAGIAGIKMAADLEQTKVAFTTMLGSAEAADKMLRGLQDFAATTPFQFPQLADAAKKLTAFGVSAEETIPTLRRIGDIAAGIGAPIGEIAEIYGKARVQGRLFAEDINQLTGRGIPVIQELAKQFGVAESEVRKLVESGEVNFSNLEQAFISLASEGGKFAGLMQAQSQTVAGLFSTLKDNVGLTLTALGETIIDAFDLRGVIGGLIERTEQIRKMFEDFRNKVKELGIRQALAELIPEDMQGKIIAIAGALTGALAPAIISIAKNIALAVKALGPWAIAGMAIAELAFLIYKNWEPISGFFKNTWTAITTWLTDTWQAISNTAITIWTTIINYLSGVWNSIATTAQTVWNSIKAFFSEWWETLLVVFTGPLGVLALLIIKNWDDIKAFTATVWDAIKQFFIDTWESIKAIFGPPIQWLIDTLSSAWDTVSSAINSAWSNIKSFFSNTWASIKQMFIAAFSSMVESASSFGRRIMEALKNAIGSVRLPIPSFSISFREGPLGVKIPDINLGINWRALRDIVPFLADGGIVTRPTLAVLGEAGREAVVPLDRGDYGTVNITITGNTIANDYDVDRIADKLVRRLRLAGVKV